MRRWECVLISALSLMTLVESPSLFSTRTLFLPVRHGAGGEWSWLNPLYTSLTSPQLYNSVFLYANHNSVTRRMENGMNASYKSFLSQLLKHLQACVRHTAEKWVSSLSTFSAEVNHLLMWDLWSVYCYYVILVASLHNSPSDFYLLEFTRLSNSRHALYQNWSL